MHLRHHIWVLACMLGGCASQPSTTYFTIDTGNVVRPTVAVASQSGDVFWSWIRKDDDGWNVYVSMAGNSSESSPPVRVNNVPGNATPHDEAPAQVAVGPEGNVYVAWANRIDVAGRRFPASNLLFSVSRDGGKSFSNERAINSDSGESPSSHTFHNIIVLDDGTIVVSWIDSRERDRRLRNTGSKPHAAVSDHKAMHGVGMAQGATDLPGSQIWVARSVDRGATFQETAVVDENSCPCCRTELAASPNGTVYLSWRHVFDNGDRDVVVARSDDAGLTFSEPVRVSRDGWNVDACPHAGPALAIDDAGRVHVAWFTGAEDAPGLYRSISNDGARSFGARTAVAASIPMAHAAFARGADGQVELAYNVPSEESVVTVSIDDGRLLKATTESGGRPSLASAGRVVARAIADGDVVRGEVVRF